MNISYSQEGEDRILADLFIGKKKGFYVDIGSHDPIRFSNTHLFYLEGWRGINIDPTPGTKMEFDKSRPDDLNLEIGIGEKEETKILYMYEEHALNTFDPERVKFLRENSPYKTKEERKVKIMPLQDVLNQYCKHLIDFVNIDVEWNELSVLRSNDWKRFRPQVLLVEILNFKLETITQNPIHQFLSENHYSFLCKTPRTCFYQDIYNPTRYK
jgi:FkbM family methyltransferase